jgi:cytochrome d ubiquinol oxidase subunit II
VLERARRFGRWAAVATIVLFALGGVMIAKGAMGMRLEGVVDAGGPSNPADVGQCQCAGRLAGQLYRASMDADRARAGLVGPLVAMAGIGMRRGWLNLMGSAAAIKGIIATVGLSMFPFILPSSIDPRSSLTVWNASSSHLTLFIMLIVTCVFLPMMLIYTAWVMKMLAGRITLSEVRSNPDFY